MRHPNEHFTGQNCDLPDQTRRFLHQKNKMTFPNERSRHSNDHFTCHNCENSLYIRSRAIKMDADFFGIAGAIVKIESFTQTDPTLIP